MDNEPWHVTRRRELESAAPVKRKKSERFVKVPLWWIETAATATRSPTTLVLIELLHIAFKTRRATFPVPNGRLKAAGVSREIKRRTLLDLERAGLVLVERPPRKTPVVTLIGL